VCIFVSCLVCIVVSCLVCIVVSFLVCIVVSCLVCIVVSCLVCIVVSCLVYIVVILCVFYVCIAVFTLDTRLPARSRYSEGPATGHLDTGFFLVSLCLKANAEMVPKIPSCHYMLLM